MTKLSKDEEAGDNFERTMGTAKSIVSKLIALKLAHELAIEIRERLDGLESLKSRNPTADHTVVLNSLSVTLEDLRKTIRNSSIDPEHELRRAAREFHTRLDQLTIERSASSTHTDGSHSSDNDVNPCHQELTYQRSTGT